MKTVPAISALIVIGVAYAASPLTPIPLPQKGSCPFGYTSDSKHCTPSNGAKFAILKGPSGSCPSNYSSKGRTAWRSLTLGLPS